MISRVFLFTFGTILGLQGSALAAPFENLGFENANTNNLQSKSTFPGYVVGIGTTADLLPGWQLFQGTNLVTTVAFNMATLSSDYRILVSTDARYTFGFEPEGRYALNLAFRGEPYSLVQQGDIPSDAHLLVYKSLRADFEARINGVRLQPFQPTPHSQHLAGIFYDVSRFAGQTVELKLTVLGGGYLDSIGFVGREPKVKASGKTIVIEWSGPATLQRADNVTGPWSDVTGAASPHSIPVQGTRKFYRLNRWTF